MGGERLDDPLPTASNGLIPEFFFSFVGRALGAAAPNSVRMTGSWSKPRHIQR